MTSDQFISLKDVPDIYTDSGSDSSDDDSIKALLPTKTRESLSSVPESSLTTPVDVPSSPLKKPTSPKRTPKSDKSETSSPKSKKTEKRDLDKTSEPKPKKVKQSKPKSSKDSDKPTEEAKKLEVKPTETKLEVESSENKQDSTPKVKYTPAPHDNTAGTGIIKETQQTPKKRSKPKKPKSGSVPLSQESTTDVVDELRPGQQLKLEVTSESEPKPIEKVDKADKPQSSPKRKKPADKGPVSEGVPKPQGDSEPKPKKQKKPKNKPTKESGSEVKDLSSKPKEVQPDSLSGKDSGKVTEKVVESGTKAKTTETKLDKEKDEVEKKDPLEVLKKMTNREIFSTLSKDEFDDIPLGSLKAKYMALYASSGSDTDSDSESDSDSGDSFIKPRLNVNEESKKLEVKPTETKLDKEKVKKLKVEREGKPEEKKSEEKFKLEHLAEQKMELDRKLEEKERKIEEEDSSDTSDYEDSDEDSDEKEDLTPKPKLASVVESPKLSGEQFINKERLQSSFKPKLDIPSGCEIYCGNLPVDISEDELRELFEECGVITRINKLNKRGVAFITFSNEESAQKASEYNNSPYKGQLLNINITTNRPAKKEFGKSGFGRSDLFSGKNKDREFTISNEICIRNLNFNSTEEGLRELFGECGQVTRCYVPKFQDSGKPMGICFITFTTVEAAKRAVEYDQTEIDGRTVSIQYAQPRGNRSSNRGRALKGRFTTGGSRISTFSRPLNNSKGSNGTNGSFKEKKDFKNGFVKASEPLNPNVGSMGSDVKPRSIIFEDSDSE